VKAVREEEVEVRKIGFMKQVGFKLGVKETECYECACGETEEKEVIGEGIGESEMEELVQYENKVYNDKVDSRQTVGYTERIDQ